jgi:hypothetical protein
MLLFGFGLGFGLGLVVQTKVGWGWVDLGQVTLLASRLLWADTLFFILACMKKNEKKKTYLFPGLASGRDQLPQRDALILLCCVGAHVNRRIERRKEKKKKKKKKSQEFFAPVFLLLVTAALLEDLHLKVFEIALEVLEVAVNVSKPRDEGVQGLDNVGDETDLALGHRRHGAVHKH